MKKIFAAIGLILLIALSSCVVDVPELELSTSEEPVSSDNITNALTEENSSSDIIVDETQVHIEHTTETEETTEELTAEVTSEQYIETTKEELTTRPVQITEASTAVPATEVDLSISMPDKNGTMQTDYDKDNKYIKIVHKKRDIDEDLLVAVFSVPESGQNYVFEFYDDDGREIEDIRRVYLINSSGEITGVSAVAANERENISSIENWFCMNVLIKEVIYPAIKSEIG